MREEVGQPCETEVVAYDTMGDQAYRAVNPMAKVPALVDDGPNGSRWVVTECAAIELMQAAA